MWRQGVDNSRQYFADTRPLTIEAREGGLAQKLENDVDNDCPAGGY